MSHPEEPPLGVPVHPAWVELGATTEAEQGTEAQPCCLDSDICETQEHLLKIVASKKKMC